MCTRSQLCLRVCEQIAALARRLDQRVAHENNHHADERARERTSERTSERVQTKPRWRKLLFCLLLAAEAVRIEQRQPLMDLRFKNEFSPKTREARTRSNATTKDGKFAIVERGRAFPKRKPKPPVWRPCGLFTKLAPQCTQTSNSNAAHFRCRKFFHLHPNWHEPLFYLFSPVRLVRLPLVCSLQRIITIINVIRGPSSSSSSSLSSRKLLRGSK